jgi:hypothetical protein
MTNEVAQSSMEHLKYMSLHARIGPIFDPAWLKLVDKTVLGEIIAVQLDAQAAILEAEQKAIAKAQGIVTRVSR